MDIFSHSNVCMCERKQETINTFFKKKTNKETSNYQIGTFEE